MAMTIRISLSYFLLFYLIMYIFILSIASSVNSEANKSYKLFNSFYIKIRKHLNYRIISFYGPPCVLAHWADTWKKLQE